MDLKFKKIKNLILLLIIGGLILVSGFLLLMFNNTNKALAYDDKTTHPDLTREVVTFSELSTGKKFTDEQKQWIIQGSIDEDFAPRWLNHFYDPVFERGLQVENIGISGYLAKNWAQFSSYQTINPANIANLWTGKGPVISGSWWGDFSYEAAIKDYSKSKEKDAYVALGHVIHLIEDMTVPEHTRNDSHPGGTMASYYENWTMTNSSGLTQDLGKRIFNQGRKPIIYSDLASYFNNLATYTNSHFFSPRTIQAEIYTKPKIVFEDGTFAYGKDESGELFDLVVVTTDKSLKKSYSLKDDNYQVMQEYWLRLSRQAIINGAGIINLFSNQAEAAKQVELARQKVENSQNAPQQSLIGYISNLLGFGGSPSGGTNEPALTITSSSQPAAPQIKPITVQPVQPKTESKSPTIEKPTSLAPTPTLTSTPAPLPNSTSSTPTSVPTPAPVVTYSGGGGGGSASSNTQQTTNNTQQTTDNAENNSNVQTFNVGDLVINEIMHNPAGTDTDHEWIEIYNSSSHEIDLTGWKLNDEANHNLNIPPDHNGQGSMILPVGGYAVLAEDAGIFLMTDYPGFSGTVIDTAALNLKQDISTVTTLKIIATNGTIIDEVTYYNSWGGNDNGKSLERKLATSGSNDPNNWAESSVNGGTPGAVNNSIAEGEGGPADNTVEDENNIIAGTGTDVSATTTISQNTTWTLSGSPYRLFFDSVNHPTVAPGAILTIAPGAKIIPQGGGFMALEIKGTLNAIATSGAPIIFTSKNDADNSASTTPQKGDWLNITFTASSTGNFDYVEFRYGGGQNLVLPFHEMVDIVGATVSINNSKFENSKSTALHLKDSSGTVQNSVFSDNYCGISVDSSNGVANVAYGGCYGIHTTRQILSSTDLQIKKINLLEIS